MIEGRLGEAAELQGSMVEVDPLSAVYRGNYGRILIGAGRYKEGLDQLRRVPMLASSERSPDISRALVMLGRTDEARIESRAIPDGPERDLLCVLLEPEPEATAALRRLQRDESAQARILLAEIAAYRGETDAAFAQIEAAAQRTPTIGALDPARDLAVALWISPFLAPLREDARWLPIVRALSER